MERSFNMGLSPRRICCFVAIDAQLTFVAREKPTETDVPLLSHLSCSTTPFLCEVRVRGISI
jgi:hypothetical protein